jgi:hypothetical protein
MNLIYKTTNLINGKIYVGQHVQHDTSEFDGYLGSGLLIKYSINKYGKENFIREIIEVLSNPELLNEREIFWIDQLSATDLSIGYNLTKGGDGQTPEFMIKKWQEPGYKEMVSEKMKNVWADLEYKEIMIETFIKAQNRPEQKEKTSKSSKARWTEPEYKERVSNLISDAMLNSEQYRKIKSDEMKLRWTDSEFREMMTTNSKKMWEDPTYRDIQTRNNQEINNRPEVKAKHVEKMTKVWAVPDYKERLRESFIIAQNRPEQKEKTSKATKKNWENSEYREKITKAMKEFSNRPEERKRRSELTRGKKNNKAIFHYQLKDPTGIVYQTDVLSEFCRTFGLKYHKMMNVCNGKFKQHHGWFCISKTLRTDK